jgi:hypothetical protein
MDVDREPATIDLVPRRFDLLEHLVLERLPGPPRVDRQDDEVVDLVEIGGIAFERGRRTEGHADAHAGRRRLADHGRRIVNSLEMERDGVGPGRRQLIEQRFRPFHLEVRVERQGRVPPQTRDHGWPDRELRDEVRIHHVHMDEVDMWLDELYLLGQSGQVRRQDRCREPGHPGILAWRVGHPAERRHEHRVAPVTVRPEAHPLRGTFGPLHGDGLDPRRAAEQRIARRVGLGPRERADAVHEPPTLGQEPRRGCRDTDLELGETGELLLVRTPQQLRAAAGGADARAGRVHEDPIEAAAYRGSAPILYEEPGMDSEPSETRADERQTSG